MVQRTFSSPVPGMASDELAEWFESLDDLARRDGAGPVKSLLTALQERAERFGIADATRMNTPYVNTIPADQEPPYPGDRKLEQRLKHLIRWNAMAMVARANRQHHGIGGHISTYASAATLPSITEIRKKTWRIRQTWTASERRQRWKQGQENQAKIFTLTAKAIDSPLLVRRRGIPPPR